jgi:TRAP-type transport system large permease protein
MTIAVFTLSLLGTMALGMPIAFTPIVCAVALMYQLDIFDSQIVAQKVINGADSLPLMAVPFLHARRRDREHGRLIAPHR